jgi:hypothetical protein
MYISNNSTLPFQEFEIASKSGWMMQSNIGLSRRNVRHKWRLGFNHDYMSAVIASTGKDPRGLLGALAAMANSLSFPSQCL